MWHRQNDISIGSVTGIVMVVVYCFVFSYKYSHNLNLKGTTRKSSTFLIFTFKHDFQVRQTSIILGAGIWIT